MDPYRCRLFDTKSSDIFSCFKNFKNLMNFVEKKSTELIFILGQDSTMEY